MAIAAIQPVNHSGRPLLNSKNQHGRHLNDAEMLDRMATVGVPLWYGWHGWVVPCVHLRPWLTGEVKTTIEAQMTDGDGKHARAEDSGWRGVLASQTALILNQSKESITRRLYSVLAGKTTILKAEMAEALLMAVDLALDRDTDIPTLPGTKREAFDLLTIRAQALDPKTKPHDMFQYIVPVLQLSAAIIESPELTSQLQDDAPFDCLRPWRVG